MISGDSMTKLFYLLYFGNFMTNFIQALFENISMIQNQTNLAFYSILTFLKVICPAIGGFVIDQTQYSLNVLLISQILSILSCIFFYGFCIQSENNYIYFALGTSILGEQMQTIMILSMISKSYKKSEIQKQYGLNYFFGVFGRILCAFILYSTYLPLSKYSDDSNEQKQEQLVYNLLETSFSLIVFSIPFVLQIGVTFCLQQSFKYFAEDARNKHPDLMIPIKANTNLLYSLKSILSTDLSITAFATVHLLSIISIWVNYEQKTLSDIQYEKTLSDIQYGSWEQLIFKVGPSIFQLTQIMRIAKNVEKDEDFYVNQTECIKQSLVQFLFGYVLFVYIYNVSNLTYSFFGFFLLMFQQYLYAYLYLTNITRIGQKVENFRTYGMSFGMFFMSINLYNFLVIISLSQFSTSTEFADQMVITYGFSFGYCFIGILVMKILSFNQLFGRLKQQKLQQIEQ